MNWDTVKGDWKQFRGKVKEAWGKLTDQELDVDCRQARSVDRRDSEGLRHRADEAERQVAQFERSYGDGAGLLERPPSTRSSRKSAKRGGRTGAPALARLTIATGGPR